MTFLNFKKLFYLLFFIGLFTVFFSALLIMGAEIIAEEFSKRENVAFNSSIISFAVSAIAIYWIRIEKYVKRSEQSSENYVIHSALFCSYVICALSSILNILIILNPTSFTEFNSHSRAFSSMSVIIHNILGVILLDFIDVFEIKIGEMEPINNTGRFIIFIFRIAITYTIADSIMKFLDSEKFPNIPDNKPFDGTTIGRIYAWFFGFSVAGLIKLAIG